MQKAKLIPMLFVAVVLLGAGCGPQGPNMPPEVIKDEHVITEQTNQPPAPDASVNVAGPVEPKPPSTAKKFRFGAAVSLNLEESATFTDGFSVKLLEIHDSRCPADVQCIWAGELAPILEVGGGKEKTSKQIQLGTVRNLQGESENYVISLNEATTTSVKVTVTLKPAAAAAKPATP